jgi:hypothetical protein
MMVACRMRLCDAGVILILVSMPLAACVKAAFMQCSNDHTMNPSFHEQDKLLHPILSPHKTHFLFFNNNRNCFFRPEKLEESPPAHLIGR